MMFLESPPQPIVGQIDKHSPAAQWFHQLAKQLDLPSQPKAVLVISAHWETSNSVHISAQVKHNELFYDYSGFPPEAYKLKYSPPGNVELSRRIQVLLQQADISAQLDENRNFDHGVFVPLKLMYPDANIPVVSMSILKSLSAAQHLAIGKALAPLRKEQVLIIGSGAPVHNIHATQSQVDSFMSELNKVVTQYNEHDREKALLNWEKVLPYARINHPREDHFLPVHVVVGAAGRDRGQLLNPSVESSQAAFIFSA